MAGKKVMTVSEVINWEERYLRYVEGDLQKDIQELKDDLKDLRTEIEGKIDGGLKDLRTELGGKIERLEGKIDRIFWLFGGILAVAVVGGLVKMFIG
jgi:archaellum component FlaC